MGKGKRDKVAEASEEGVLRLQDEVQPLPPAHAQEGTLPDGYTVHKRKLVKVKKAKVRKVGKKAA